ncbi:unnamed protein product, partial [Phaeothamnion confervicola]
MMRQATKATQKVIATTAAQAPRASAAAATQAKTAARASASNAALVLQRIKGTVLDAMARALPDSDRTFLAHKWGMVSQAEAQAAAALEAQSAAEAAARSARTEAEATAALKAKVLADEAVAAAKREAEKEAAEKASALARAQARAEAVEKEARSDPVLGQLVHDAGYKRVFCTSVERLIKVPVWEKQRILRPERAAAIAKDKMMRQSKGMPGVITLFHRTGFADARPSGAGGASNGKAS